MAQKKAEKQPEEKKIPTMSIPLEEARAPFVLGIDVGSSASRGGLYDATGCPVNGSKQRIAHEFSTDYDGTSVIDADQVVKECGEIIDAIVDFSKKNKLKISGVAMDSFASSLVLVDASGHALTSAITYADSRCAPYVMRLREQIDEIAYHDRAGVRLHTSYHPARLVWAREELPELWEETTTVMNIGEYVYLHLAGIRGMATATAAWSGLLNLRTGQLDTEILEQIGVSADLFDPIHTPSQAARPEKTKWKKLNGIRWFHAIPDGWPSNIGPGAVDENTVAVAAATSGAMRVIVPGVPERVPSGLWCYGLDEEHSIMGGALNDVGRAIAWLERTLAPLDPVDLGERLAGPPDEDTPFVLPFFSGERATGWAADARAALSNISDDTTVLDIWAGVIEGLAISYERIWEELDDAGLTPSRIIASGRVSTNHPTWLQVLADALGVPVSPLAMKRATLRGTALIALEVIDPGGKRAVPPFGEPFQPREEYAEYYDRAREEFERLYKGLVL